MALSAFRSTTRRGCQIGSSGGEAATSGVPSTPSRSSKRDPSPSPSGTRGSRGHRRSSSISDFSSAKYLSDCDYQGSQTRRRGRSSSICPSDSESDVDFLFTHCRQVGQRSSRLEDTVLSRSIANDDHNDLRRSSNIGDSRRHDCNKEDLRRTDTEEVVEEKTIQHVFAKMKSLQSNPPVADLSTSDLLDTMRSEVQRAVTEIRMELEESTQKKCSLSGSHDRGGTVQESLGVDVSKAMIDIRNEYSTKLAQSEERVRELWSQLAVEEQRCSELTKIVKELCPTPPGPQPCTGNERSSRRRPLKRRNSAGKPEDMSLDDEALKYFEECVSLSTFNGDTDDSVGESGQQQISVKDSILSEQHSIGDGVNENRASKDVNGSVSQPQWGVQNKSQPVESDGVVLPWLQWEAETAPGDKSPKKGVRRHLSPKHTSNGSNNGLTRVNHGSSNPFYTSNHAKASIVKRPASFGTSESSVVGGRSENTLLPQTKSAKSTIFVVEDSSQQRISNLAMDPEAFLSGRIKFKGRVERGELVLCQGLFI